MLVSYFGVQAFFLTLLEKLLKGLTGYGYWLWAAALAVVGVVLVGHGGRPVCLRVTGTLAIPVLSGSLLHLLLLPCGVCTGRDRTAVSARPVGRRAVAARRRRALRRTCGAPEGGLQLRRRGRAAGALLAAVLLMLHKTPQEVAQRARESDAVRPRARALPAPRGRGRRACSTEEGLPALPRHRLRTRTERHRHPRRDVRTPDGSAAGGQAADAGAELRNNSRRLAETLKSFGVDARAGDVVRGPSVTRYEFTLDQGVKLSKITNLADDIALALGASGVRIAPIPDKISVVGIEVPNKLVSAVHIRDVLESREFTQHKSSVAFAVGKDIAGNNIIGNIAKLPHVLIAGTTGSGKSVCTNSLIVSLLYKSTPDEVRFIMVDPKMVELAPYNGIPHLLIPVVTDPKKAAGALQWAVYEMMKRYKLFSEHNVKDLAGYNALAAADETLKKLPSVVVVIDELADLMLVAAKEVEESICRVAQMGRAAGMHLVIATQRPSADVITGLMKANIPSRIAFAVASSLESRIILDTTGAEKLVGRGDMSPARRGPPPRAGLLHLRRGDRPRGRLRQGERRRAVR